MKILTHADQREITAALQMAESALGLALRVAYDAALSSLSPFTEGASDMPLVETIRNHTHAVYELRLQINNGDHTE